MFVLYTLLILAEICGVGGKQLFGPIGNGLRLAGEEAQGLGLVGEAQTADEVSVVVKPLHSVDHVFGLRQGEYAAGEGKTNHFHRCEMLASVGVTLFGQSTSSHTADAAAKVECGNQRPCRVLLLRNVADHLLGIDVCAKSAVSFQIKQLESELDCLLFERITDLIVTLDNHVYRSDYVIAKEEPVSMHFVTGAGSSFAGNRDLSVQEIARCPFILTEKHMGYRRSFDEELSRRSLEVVPILEIGRTDLITDLLEQRFAVSYLPDFVTERKVKEGKLVYLQVSDFKTDIWKQLIYHKNKWISRSFHALIEYINVMEFGDRGGRRA